MNFSKDHGVELNLSLKTLSLYCYILAFFFAFESQASLFDSHNNTARLNATGRTGIAATGRNTEELFFLNPAILASKASIQFWGSYANGEASVGEDQRQLSLGVVDSTAGTWDPRARGQFQDFGRFPIAAGLTYNRIKNEFYRDEYFTLGFAQAMSSNLAVGILGNYSILESRIGGEDKNFFDLGLGLVYQVAEWLSLGASAQNILNQRKDYEAPHLRRALGAGGQVRMGPGIFLRADVWGVQGLDEQQKWIYRLGMENHLGEYIRLRMGFGEDPSLRTKILGLGLSFVGPRLALHYGFQRETSTGKAMHSVDFQLPIW